MRLLLLVKFLNCNFMSLHFRKILLVSIDGVLQLLIFDFNILRFLQLLQIELSSLQSGQRIRKFDYSLVKINLNSIKANLYLVNVQKGGFGGL